MNATSNNSVATSLAANCEQKTLCKSDNIFATLTTMGRTVRSIHGNNFENIHQIIGAACAGITTKYGIARVTVRNATKGWQVVTPIVLRTATA